MNEKVHIGIACNDVYARPAGVLMSSILHHTQSPVYFHLFTYGISEENQAWLHRVVSLSATAHLEVVKGLAIRADRKGYAVEYISNETWCRLMAHKLLPDVDKLLYLDIDLLILGDVAQLYDRDISGFMAAGVEEEQMRTNGYPESIGMSSAHGYVNACVLLMNLRALRNSGKGDELIAGINAIGGRFMDQDVLNSVLHGQMVLLPRRFNFNLYYYRVYKRERKQALVIHFTGPDKPWLPKGRRRWCNRLWRMSAVRLRIALCMKSNGHFLNELISRLWFAAASVEDSLIRIVSKTFERKKESP